MTALSERTGDRRGSERPGVVHIRRRSLGPVDLVPHGLPRYGDAALAVIDDVMDEDAIAHRALSRQFHADLTSLAPFVPGIHAWSAERLESFALTLAGGTQAELRLLAMLAQARAQRGQDADTAATLALRALEGGRLLAAGVRSPVPLAVGMVLGLAGHTEAAEEHFSEIISRALETRSFAVLAAAFGQRGTERFRRGELPAAREDLEAAVDVSQGQPWETLIDDGRACLLSLHIERGSLDEAERELDAWGAAGPLPDTAFGNRLLVERGRLRLSQARLADAVSDLELVARRVTRSGDATPLEWRGAAAVAYHKLGEQTLALELAHQDLELARAWGAPRQLGVATATLGLIEGGRDGIGRMREGLEILQRSSARLDRARILVLLGRVLRRTGQPAEARAHLRAGLELAVWCGASSLANAAEQEIAASGMRRRCRTQLSGPDALTPSEHRVACLAADGLSNPDIANALYITRKTVEMHLGNAYRKLRINSRQQLRSLLVPAASLTARASPGSVAERPAIGRRDRTHLGTRSSDRPFLGRLAESVFDV
jgi:DNA-binding CsgD family transcriptional regulator